MENSSLTREYGGYRFVIDTHQIKPVLLSLMKAYTRNRKAGENIIDALSSRPLPAIGICGDIIIQEYFLRNNLHIWCAGLYNPQKSDVERSEVLITAVDILEVAAGTKKSRFGKRFSGKPREWFAYILAHELRHWFQNIAMLSELPPPPAVKVPQFSG